jgi:hypothetical protein
MFLVEWMRDGRAIKRAQVSAGSDAESAKVWGQVKAGLGREPIGGDFIRVTHQASGRTSWFLLG